MHLHAIAVRDMLSLRLAAVLHMEAINANVFAAYGDNSAGGSRMAPTESTTELNVRSYLPRFKDPHSLFLRNDM